nr:hypothetical protein [uncultured Dorea sp.]
MEISYQVRFTKEDGNSSAIPAGTLEGGIAICGLLNKVSIYHMECNKKLASPVENVITYVRWM